MRKSREILLTLIRSALWGRPVEDFPSDVEWKKVCVLAKQQTLVGLLADAIQKLPADQRPESKTMAHLRAYVMKNVFQNSLCLALTI